VTTAGVQSTEDEAESKTEEKAEGKNAEAPEKCLEEDLIKDTEEESTSLQGEPEAEQAEPKEQAAGAATAGVQSIADKENESKTEEKAEGKNAEASEKCLEEDLTKDTNEESKSLQGEPEAEQAEWKEHSVDAATAGVQSLQDKETESKTEGNAEGKIEEQDGTEKSEDVEASRKITEDDAIKDTDAREDTEEKSKHEH